MHVHESRQRQRFQLFFKITVLVVLMNFKLFPSQQTVISLIIEQEARRVYDCNKVSQYLIFA